MCPGKLFGNNNKQCIVRNPSTLILTKGIITASQPSSCSGSIKGTAPITALGVLLSSQPARIQSTAMWHSTEQLKNLELGQVTIRPAETSFISACKHWTKYICQVPRETNAIEGGDQVTNIFQTLYPYP